MKQKIIIGILFFLIIASSSGLYFYSYTLDQQIKFLHGQLEATQREQAVQTTQLSNELASFREEAINSIAILGDKADIIKDEVNTLGEVIDGTTGRIDTIEDEVAGVVNKVSQSVINTNEVYQKLSEVTVSISDGENTVGSGFIFDADGHIVTAHHVVEQLPTIYIVLSSGRSSEATVTGSCKYSDIAVLTPADKGLITEPPVIADSSKVQIGESLATIGSPFDLPGTLTSGIVSQLDRFSEIEYDGQTRPVANLIQFDAAVNFGNSGGPVVNSDGEIIGLVVARVNPEMGDGIQYAVSSNKVKRVAASLITTGSFNYPWMGAGITDITPKTLRDRGLETTNGTLVKIVLPDSPAEAAGIQADDILVAIDTMQIENTGQFVSYLGEYVSPDELVSLTLIRDSMRLELSLKIGGQSS
ncbi:S1C family serine protease [Chloroflexota bacterium]